MTVSSICEASVTVRGGIRAWFVGPGPVIPVVEHANILSYGSADVLAQLLAGVTAAAPSAIGVIYGPDLFPSLEHPSVTRDHGWESVAEQVGAIGGNVAIMPLSLTPSIASSDAGVYGGNVATFSANTGAVAAYAFSGLPFCGTLETLDPAYVYQVLLLAGRPTAYTIFARSTLMDGGLYKVKPDGFHLAVEWPVTFK